MCLTEGDWVIGPWDADTLDPSSPTWYNPTKLPSGALQMVTAAMKLKDAFSLEEKLWPT